MSKNDITGDEIATKNISESYRNNYDAIFRKKPPVNQLEVYTCTLCGISRSYDDTNCSLCNQHQVDYL